MSTGTESIVVEYELAQAPGQLWRVLTDSQLVATWLMANDLVPAVGHRFTFRARPVPGWDGVVHCEVLEVEPNRRLRYSWRGGSDELPGYGGRLDTTVTWTLTPSPSGGTQLRLEHAGFTAKNAFAIDMMGKGWRGKIAEEIARVASTLA